MGVKSIKRGTFTIGLLAVALLACSNSGAAFIAYEDFSGLSLGALGGQGGGAGWNGNWTLSNGTVTVADRTADPLSYTPAGGAAITGGNRAMQISFVTDSNPANGPLVDIARNLATTFNGDEFYLRFLCRVDASTIATSDREIMGVDAKDYLGVGGASQWTAELSDVNCVTGSVAGSALTGPTHLLIARFFRTTPGVGNNYKNVQLWVDPTFAQPAPGGTQTVGAGFANSFSQVFFGQSQLEGNEVMLADEVLVGTTWADVISPTPVPEPAALALFALGGLALLRRRK